MTHVVHEICHAVGMEMSELEGCWCHAEVLADAETYKKRRLKMLELTGAPVCPWKGKQIVPMTMGKSKVIISRVKNHRSATYTLAWLMRLETWRPARWSWRIM